MSRRPSLRRAAFVLAAASFALAPATGAFAQGGSGSGGGGAGGGGGGGGAGGGTPAPVVGVIQRASAAAVCDGPTTAMSITVDKGFNKRVELAIAYSGIPSGNYENFRLVNDATGTSVNSFGSFPSSGGTGLTTSLGGTVPQGSVELSFTWTLRSGSFTGPLLETCSAHISTFAK